MDKSTITSKGQGSRGGRKFGSHPCTDGEAGGEAKEDDDGLRHVQDVEAGQQLVLGALIVGDCSCILAALEGLVGEKLDSLPVQQRICCSGPLPLTRILCQATVKEAKHEHEDMSRAREGTFALSKRFMSDRNWPLHSVR